MRFREDKSADLERARAVVAEWREQHPAGTEDELISALGSQFHPEYGPVLRAALFALDQHRARNVTEAGPARGTRPGIRLDLAYWPRRAGGQYRVSGAQIAR